MSASSFETGEGSVSAETDPSSAFAIAKAPSPTRGEGKRTHRADSAAPHFATAHLLDTHTRTPPRLETIVVEHPRLCIHGAATFLRGDVDGRRHLDLGLRGRRWNPPQQGFRDHGPAGVPAFSPVHLGPGPMPLRLRWRSTAFPDLRFGLCGQHANRCERSNANGKKEKPGLRLHRSLPLRLVERGSNLAFYSGHMRSKIWLASTSKPSKRHLG